MIIKKFLLLLINIYRNLISPHIGCCCRFYPNCSLYAYIAIDRFGFFYGSYLIFIRILKCQPFYKTIDWYDPVPISYSKLIKYKKVRLL